MSVGRTGVFACGEPATRRCGWPHRRVGLRLGSRVLGAASDIDAQPRLGDGSHATPPCHRRNAVRDGHAHALAGRLDHAQRVSSVSDAARRKRLEACALSRPWKRRRPRPLPVGRETWATTDRTISTVSAAAPRAQPVVSVGSSPSTLRSSYALGPDPVSPEAAAGSARGRDWVRAPEDRAAEEEELVAREDVRRFSALSSCRLESSIHQSSR